MTFKKTFRARKAGNVALKSPQISQRQFGDLATFPAFKTRERPPGLIDHVLTVLAFWSWVLLRPWLPPSSWSLRWFPWASIVLHGWTFAWICCQQLPCHPCKNRTHTTSVYSTTGHTLSKSVSERVSTGVWCVPGFGAGFETALKPSKLQKEGENLGKGHLYLLRQTLVCTKPWFKGDQKVLALRWRFVA